QGAASQVCLLTVKLRGGAQTPDWSRGCTLSFRARGADIQAVHGPLQRLLDRTVTIRAPLEVTIERFDAAPANQGAVALDPALYLKRTFATEGAFEPTRLLIIVTKRVLDTLVYINPARSHTWIVLFGTSLCCLNTLSTGSP